MTKITLEVDTRRLQILADALAQFAHSCGMQMRYDRALDATTLAEDIAQATRAAMVQEQAIEEAREMI
jgi:hypothetical protein